MVNIVNSIVVVVVAAAAAAVVFVCLFVCLFVFVSTHHVGLFDVSKSFHIQVNRNS